MQPSAFPLQATAVPAPATAAATTPVIAVAAGPHRGTLLTTAQARFEIVTSGDGGVEVWVTDAIGADVPLSQVALPILRLDLPDGPTVVVLGPGEGRFQGRMEGWPGAAVVRFDAAVNGVVLGGISATIGAPPATEEDATPVAAEAPPPAPEPTPAAAEAPAPATEPAPAEEETAQPAGVAKAPSSGWRPGKRGPQAQTFAPSPLAPAPPVRGNVVTTPRPAEPRPPVRGGVTLQPGAGVQPR